MIKNTNSSKNSATTTAFRGPCSTSPPPPTTSQPPSFHPQPPRIAPHVATPPKDTPFSHHHRRNNHLAQGPLSIPLLPPPLPPLPPITASLASPNSHFHTLFLRFASVRDIYSTDTFNSAAPPPQFSGFPTSPGPVLNQPLQESSNRNIVQESYTLADTLPVIHRTVSDPNPVRNLQVVAGSGTPPLPPLSRNVSRSPSRGESPSTKRLKRMRDRLKEMSQWWNQVVREGEEEENEAENYSTDNVTNEESENDMENPPQEAVWVEKNGESLILHFKCPCGNEYQILLFRQNCYYKLTNYKTH
ncbi:UNVERIFIED_CONTAM: hypothetical protein Sangu_1878200 [Sesamum angustifolium]|uniref:Uncharacterized protein n=1 Tax=Sesamum angustifolium TaxID=2727405 RepID=A0AAW2LU08_9LAMI